MARKIDTNGPSYKAGFTAGRATVVADQAQAQYRLAYKQGYEDALRMARKKYADRLAEMREAGVLSA